MIETAFIVVLTLILVYAVLVRPWLLCMGATAEEIASAMPGDGLVNKPNLKYTQAVTINAPRETVWAYVVQMGYKRAGWYNWDFINRLADPDYFYKSNRSAERIIPELQNLQEGDKIYLTPQLGMEAEKVERPHTLMLNAKQDEKYLVVWTYQMRAISDQTTRLLVRWSSNLNEGWGLRVLNYLMIEPGGVGIQQSQNLKGIKARAERDYLQNRLP